MNTITIDTADIFNWFMHGGLFLGTSSLIVMILCLVTKNRTYYSVYGILIGFAVWGIMSLIQEHAEARYTHEEQFSKLTIEWQDFYATLNKIGDADMIQSAISNFVSDNPPVLTIDEYDVLSGKSLFVPQRTAVQNSIKNSPSLRKIIYFDFGKGKE